MISTLLRLFLLLLILGIITATGLVIHTISSFPYYTLEKERKSQTPSSIKNIATLDAGGVINKKDLYCYLLFSESEMAPLDYISEQIDRELLLTDTSSGKLIINKTIDLSALKKNECQKSFCYKSTISFNKMPNNILRALIGTEDYRFLFHSGVDFSSIIRAAVVNATSLSFDQGASTLTQQLIKNLFLTREKTIQRKLKEIIYSIYLETNFSKEDILEIYLNEMYWGVMQGIRIEGVEAASIFYFQKKAKELSPYESTVLISLLKGPAYYNPTKHLTRLKERSNAVWKRLLELNQFSKKNAAWSDNDWQSWQKNLLLLQEEKTYFSLIHAQKAQKTSKQSSNFFDMYDAFVFSNSALKILREKIKQTNGRDLAIKAIIGSVDKETQNDNLFYFYSKSERNIFDAISKEKHQIGSTIKPIIYHFFNQHGKKNDDLVDVAPIELQLKSGKWAPKEAHSLSRDLSQVSLKEALAKSYNAPVVRLSQEIGFDLIQKDLLDFFPTIKTPVKEFPAQLLGALELSLHEMFEAYKKFVQNQCMLYSTNLENENSINTDSILWILSDPNQTTISKVVKGPMKNMRFFGKTGTSNLGHDNWFVFFDGKLLGIIWLGLEGVKDDKNLQLYGSNTAFSIYQEFSNNRGKRFNNFSCPRKE